MLRRADLEAAPPALRAFRRAECPLFAAEPNDRLWDSPDYVRITSGYAAAGVNRSARNPSVEIRYCTTYVLRTRSTGRSKR